MNESEVRARLYAILSIGVEMGETDEEAKLDEQTTTAAKLIDEFIALYPKKTNKAWGKIDHLKLEKEGGPFFIWRVGGPSIPKFAHVNYESAETEAKRLAGLFPESKFIMLGPIATVQQKPVIEAPIIRYGRRPGGFNG